MVKIIETRVRQLATEHADLTSDEFNSKDLKNFKLRRHHKTKPHEAAVHALMHGRKGKVEIDADD